MEGFKYNVGDRVFMLTAFDDSLMACRHGDKRMPCSFMIVERMTQECPGGIQYHYLLSGGNLHQPLRALNVEIGGLFSELDAKQFTDALAVHALAKEKSDDERHERWKASLKKAESTTQE